MSFKSQHLIFENKDSKIILFNYFIRIFLPLPFLIARDTISKFHFFCKRRLLHKRINMSLLGFKSFLYKQVHL
jgi:hypothetical protein